MATFASIKPQLDAMAAEELISAAEYISEQLDKQLGQPSDPPTSPTTSGAEEVQDRTPSRLLKLPRELRDIILSYAFPSRANSTIHDGNKSYQSAFPALLHTCSQLRSEAAECYFSQHTFVFWSDARFGRLAKLLAISGNVWNGFVKRVVLVPDDHTTRENPWDVYDPNWSASVSRQMREEAKLREHVVWTAMRKAGLGRELRYEVVGEVAIGEDEPSVEMVIG